MKADKYMRILAIFINSIFQEFESFFRTENDLFEDDIRLVFDEYNSSFITFKLEPVIYTFEDLPEALFKIRQSEYEPFNKSIVIEFYDITMITKINVRSGIITIRFYGKPFFNNILDFNHGWHYKHYNE